MEGVVVDRHANDAAANVVVEAGGYDVVFGHLASDSKLVKPGDQIAYGTQLGSTDNYNKHLHMAVRGNGRFYNSLYFFTSGLASTIELKMGPYSEGENAWSMTYFTYSSGRCKNYYWGAEPDRTGIGLER